MKRQAIAIALIAGTLTSACGGHKRAQEWTRVGSFTYNGITHSECFQKTIDEHNAEFVCSDMTVIHATA